MNLTELYLKRSCILKTTDVIYVTSIMKAPTIVQQVIEHITIRNNLKRFSTSYLMRNDTECFLYRNNIRCHDTDFAIFPSLGVIILKVDFEDGDDVMIKYTAKGE